MAEAALLADPRFATYLGIVKDRDDPLNLGRIRFVVPGLVEPISDWTQPVGGFASDQQGIAWVPEVNSLVLIFFHQGNINQPFYLSGPWAKPDGNNEFPTEAQNNPDVKVIKTKKFRIVLDDKDGQEKLTIGRIGDSLRIEIDDSSGSVLIKSSGTVNIEGVSGPATLRPCLETLITQINTLTFGGNAIDAPLVITPGTNVTTDTKAS